MNKLVENNIRVYISYFQDQVQSIDSHCPKTMDGDLHSRILYMALLDAISRSVFAREENERESCNLYLGFVVGQNVIA